PATPTLEIWTVWPSARPWGDVVVIVTELLDSVAPLAVMFNAAPVPTPEMTTVCPTLRLCGVVPVEIVTMLPASVAPLTTLPPPDEPSPTAPPLDAVRLEMGLVYWNVVAVTAVMTNDPS